MEGWRGGFWDGEQGAGSGIASSERVSVSFERALLGVVSNWCCVSVLFGDMCYHLGLGIYREIPNAGWRPEFEDLMLLTILPMTGTLAGISMEPTSLSGRAKPLNCLIVSGSWDCDSDCNYYMGLMSGERGQCERGL